MKKTTIKATFILAFLMCLSPLFSQNQLTGTVNYHNDPNMPMPEVTLQLIDMSNVLLQTTTTNDFGEYYFDSIPNGSYYLESSTSLAPGQVTLQDAYLIMMHLFGMYSFTDVEFAASDVNGSGTITWSDYFIVVINYLLQGQGFPVGEWQFQPIQLDFSSRTASGTDTTSVWATGSGDVEGIWVPTGRSLASITSAVNNQVTLSSETTEINIMSNYSELISGFNLNLNYPSELMTITGVEGPDGNLDYAVDHGVVKIIWMDESEHAGSHVYGDQLCTLLVTRNIDASDNQISAMVLDDNGMILDQSGLPVEGAEIQLPNIKSGKFDQIISATNYPNPVINQLNIRIDSDMDINRTIFIYDISGILLQQTNLNATQSNVASVYTDQLAPGSYTYQIRSDFSDQETLTGRFFKSK